MNPIPSSEITPKEVYLSRKDFIKGASLTALGALVLAACKGDPGSMPTAAPTSQVTESKLNPNSILYNEEINQKWDKTLDPLTDFESVTNYNNYYEFSTDKTRVAKLSQNFQTTPWTIEISGMVNKPQTFGIEDLLSKYDLEERIYRLRCVEAWSMVIPWIGFPLSKLLNDVEPTSAAKYLKFTTLADWDQMPGLSAPFPWPYIEGLRLDEAMHDLTILSIGLYGDLLLPQNGAPIRLVVPWKYGFKSIKSIVRIELTDQMPTSLWMATAPNEYGFYANVNPEVNHPRWSQASERRIGETSRRETLMFNGYADEVAHLYQDMDLSKWF